MKKIMLLSAVCCFNFYLISAQPGRPDQAFGKNGVAKTDIGKHYANQPGNSGFKVLVTAQGTIFVVVESLGSTFISKRHANGTLDSSYGEKGFSVIAGLKGSDAILQKDGKIVVAGFTGDNSYNNFAVARYTSDGNLDNTFSENGIQTATSRTGYSFANSVTLQNDGRIVVAGYINQDFGLARYNSDGSIDSSFSADGKEVTDFYGQTDVGESVVIQKDGKIVVSGYATTGFNISFALARYNADGSLDNTFSEDGKQVTAFNGNSYAYSSAIQNDGKVIVAGLATDFGSNVLALSRYSADGSPDSTFDADGKQTTAPGTTYNLQPGSLSLQNDQKIILASSSGNGSNYNFTILRYTKNGSLDNTFSGDGKQITDFNGRGDNARSVAIQKNGKIIVCGEIGVPAATTNFGLSRYNADGSADSSFGKNGIIQGKLLQGSTVYKSTAIQKDGKIVAAGYTWNGENFKFAVTRFKSNGSPDSTFSGNGTKTTSIGSGDDYGNSVAIQADGKIVVGGSAFNGKNRDFAFARYTTGGEADSTFSGDGKQKIAFGFVGDDYANAVAIQADGKIVAAGVSKNNAALIRLTENGDPDTSFGGGDGRQLTNYGELSVAKTVAIQRDGKIVVGGISGGDFILARYSSNGYPDKTFAANGKLKSNFGYDYNSINAIAIQPDGTIVAAADVSYLESTNGFVVARFTYAGKRDSSFGKQGKVVPDDVFSFINAIALQNDGKILAGGVLGDHSAITRININGSLDSTFGQNGIQVTQTIGSGNFVYGITVENNDLYAAGTCRCPGNIGTVIKYLLDIAETHLPVNKSRVSSRSIAATLKTNGNTGIIHNLTLRLSPNPVCDILTINVTGLTGDKPAGISVMSSSGVLLKTTRIPGSSQSIHLNISTLNRGMYIIKIKSETGVIYKQFLKM